MSAYVIAQIRVRDPAEYQKYLDGFADVFRRHHGKVVARSPETHVIEGEWALPRTVILRFPTAEDARRWHNDPDYRTIAEHRHRSADCNLVMVDGVD